MRGLPEPGPAIMRGLQAEKPFVTVWIMDEADVLDLEVGLPLFPFLRPGQMGFVELLPQLGNFNRIGRRKENIASHRLTQHPAISLLRTIQDGSLALGMSLDLPDGVRA
jgi:hypothetical protein